MIRHRNEQNQVIDDVYGDPNSYQANCMDISGELMTFCVGGPRYFENNVCLENSFHHTDRNQARDIHQCVFRDCKFVYGSPLFRQHYEFPTNPSLKESNEHEPWWDIEDRESDLFEDADEYGYVATQLIHLLRFAGYDAGNMLSYSGSFNAHLREELTASKTLLDFLRQTRTLPF